MARRLKPLKPKTIRSRVAKLHRARGDARAEVRRARNLFYDKTQERKKVYAELVRRCPHESVEGTDIRAQVYCPDCEALFPRKEFPNADA